MTKSETLQKRIALVGFGNVGREVLEALESAPDMKPAGVILRNPQKAEILRKELSLPVVGDVGELSGGSRGGACHRQPGCPRSGSSLFGKGNPYGG